MNASLTNPVDSRVPDKIAVIFGRATVIFSGAENRAIFFLLALLLLLCIQPLGCFFLKKKQPHNGVFVLGLSYLGEGGEALGGRGGVLLLKISETTRLLTPLSSISNDAEMHRDKAKESRRHRVAGKKPAPAD